MIQSRKLGPGDLIANGGFKGFVHTNDNTGVVLVWDGAPGHDHISHSSPIWVFLHNTVAAGAPTKDDGGPAFPTNEITMRAHHVGGDQFEARALVTKIIPGMTLRDYFAGQVLLGYGLGMSPASVAHAAYDIADAMLEARKR